MIAVSLQSLSCFVILMAFDCYYSITIQRPEQEEVLKEKIRAQAGGEHITAQNTCHNYLVFSSFPTNCDIYTLMLGHGCHYHCNMLIIMRTLDETLRLVLPISASIRRFVRGHIGTLALGLRCTSTPHQRSGDVAWMWHGCVYSLQSKM